MLLSCSRPASCMGLSTPQRGLGAPGMNQRSLQRCSAADRSYVAPSSAPAADELKLLRQHSVVVPDRVTGSLAGNTEFLAGTQAATVTYSLLATVVSGEKSLGVTPLEVAARMAFVCILEASHAEHCSFIQWIDSILRSETVAVRSTRSLSGPPLSLHAELHLDSTDILIRCGASGGKGHGQCGHPSCRPS